MFVTAILDLPGDRQGLLAVADRPAVLAQRQIRKAEVIRRVAFGAAILDFPRNRERLVIIFDRLVGLPSENRKA
jgi:hypothetical protein